MSSHQFSLVIGVATTTNLAVMVGSVHPLDVLLELVLTFKLSAARLTHKLAVLRVAQHV